MPLTRFASRTTTRRDLAGWLLALVLAAASLTCGGDIANPEPEPRALEPVAGDGQVGPIGQPLPESLAVVVKDAEGRPFGGAVVAWTGGGKLNQPTVVSGRDGRAAVQWVLGDIAGRQTTAATVSGLAPVVFSATAEAQTQLVPRLVISTEPSSNAQSGVPLQRQPAVRLESGSGQAIASGIVTVSAEGATLSGTTEMRSDASGMVRFSGLALGGLVGSYHLTFSAPDVPPAQSGTIALGAGPARDITILTPPPSTALDHEIFPPQDQPVVRVTDGYGNPVAGATVAGAIRSGGGNLEGVDTAITGVDGRAAFGDLALAGAGVQTIRLSAGSVSASAGVTVAPLSPAATAGQWGPVINWSANGADIVPLQIHLLPTGKVLAWGHMGQPWVWTPPQDGDPAAAGSFQEFPVDTMLFCAGHAFLPDGRLLVSGGHLSDDHGLAVTYTFDPFAERWSAKGELPNMARGRWYPTVTVLADGRAVTMAGRDSAGTVVGVPEVWEGGRWIPLSGASKQFPYYPRNFLAPDGRVFYAGERVQSWWLAVDASNASGRGLWNAGPSHLWPFNRDYGAAVMYRPGKILSVGGGGDPSPNRPTDTPAAAPTATAEIIDLNQMAPAWTATGSMQFPRRNLNATILPDGQVLATGGESGAGFNDLATAVHAAELWNPESGAWTTLASSAVNRGYHSVSLLLPDGSVLHGASGDANAPRETSHEIFSPPYLFKGNRPTIVTAPGSAGYGQTFDVQTPYAPQITRVSLIRLGSVTHAFDQNARFLPLGFSRGEGGIQVTAPADPRLAPPGHYLLFLLNRNGVPSEARIIQLR